MAFFGLCGASFRVLQARGGGGPGQALGYSRSTLYVSQPLFAIKTYQNRQFWEVRLLGLLLACK